MDHADIAQQVFDLPPAPRTAEQALTYVTKLLAALPQDEKAGYLSKPAGDNIAPLPDGRMVSCSRVCYPDGHIFKTMSDAPNGGPQWVDNGMVDPGAYIPFIAFVPPVAPAPQPAAAMTLEEAVAEINVHADANTEKLQTQIDQAIKNAEASAKQFAAAAGGAGFLAKIFGKG